MWPPQTLMFRSILDIKTLNHGLTVSGSSSRKRLSDVLSTLLMKSTDAHVEVYAWLM